MKKRNAEPTRDENKRLLKYLKSIKGSSTLNSLITNAIKEITGKFKELKSLVLDYKEDKEKEISNLSSDQLKLKNELEAHKINYESLVDKATLEIENFISSE